MLDPCVVDQDVDPAEVLYRLYGQRRDLVFLADVGGHGVCLSAEILNFVDDFYRGLLVSEVVDDHTCALARERERDRLTDAAVAAGHDCDLTGIARMRVLLLYRDSGLTTETPAQGSNRERHEFYCVAPGSRPK